jgi:hypothetical protein
MTNIQIAQKHGLSINKSGSFIFNCKEKYFVAYINENDSSNGGQGASSLKEVKAAKKNWSLPSTIVFKKHANSKNEFFIKY